MAVEKFVSFACDTCKTGWILKNKEAKISVCPRCHENLREAKVDERFGFYIVTEEFWAGKTEGLNPKWYCEKCYCALLFDENIPESERVGDDAYYGMCNVCKSAMRKPFPGERFSIYCGHDVKSLYSRGHYLFKKDK